MYVIRHITTRSTLRQKIEDHREAIDKLTFELEDDEENLYRYRIVGGNEIDLPNDYISVDAPLARGLLGKRLDDEVEVRLPKGKVNYCIVGVHYHKPDWDVKTWYQPPAVLKFDN
ncbi:MAG: GreA/GreB family elongation factor [Oleispira sp.]|nr:GreA/GreB family elongation factor [Oleispira sp.]